MDVVFFSGQSWLRTGEGEQEQNEAGKAKTKAAGKSARSTRAYQTCRTMPCGCRFLVAGAGGRENAIAPCMTFWKAN
jgi:hypothetical protein